VDTAASKLLIAAFFVYVVLGASGNTGHVVAKTLLSRGQKVRKFASSVEVQSAGSFSQPKALRFLWAMRPMPPR
jgi:hypothetical protein